MHLLSQNQQGSLKEWLEDLKEFQLDSIFETNVLGRAFLYAKSVSHSIEEDNKVESKVGSDSIYKTSIINKKGLIYGTCSCPFDGKCKHLAASLLVLIKS